MKKFAATAKTFAFAAVGIAIFLGFFIEYSRGLPENLNVFVVLKNTDMMLGDTLYGDALPKEFYSGPQARLLIDRGGKVARMTLTQARSWGLSMNEESKADFSCTHNFLTWKLIDFGFWPGCEWNEKGEWL